MQESRIDDYWNIDGSRDLSDSLTGFTQVTLLEEKPPDGYMWSGGRLTKRQVTSRPDYLWTELWTKVGRSKNGQLKNQSSIMLEDYEEFISLTLRTRSSKKPLRLLGRNWKHQWLPLCLARDSRKSKNGEIRSKTHDFKSKFACILEASDSTRMRMEESLPNYYEDHIAGRGEIHYNITIWYTNLFLCLKQ